MKREYILLAMFRAMDCLYDEQENPSAELLLFLDDLSPYNFKDRKAADSALQADFDSAMERQNIGAEVEESAAYQAVKNFLTEQNPQFAKMFEDISLEEWKALCDIIAEEENFSNQERR